MILEGDRPVAQERFWSAYREEVAHPVQRRTLIPAILAIPRAAGILPSSTAKPSHARIMVGERTPSQAQNFHEIMKEKLT